MHDHHNLNSYLTNTIKYEFGEASKNSVEDAKFH